MPRNKDYIPANSIKFLEWVKTLVEYADENYERWGVIPPNERMRELLADFTEKLAKCSEPNSGRVDYMEKTETRVKLEKLSRVYVQGFLARNPNVTLSDKGRMKLTVKDATPTNVPLPMTQVTGTLSFRGVGLIEIRDIRTVGENKNEKTTHGVRIYYGVMGEPTEKDRFRLIEPPTSGKHLPHSVFTRRSKYLFDFNDDRGKEVFFCMRFENAKGQAGPYGDIISAFIP